MAMSDAVKQKLIAIRKAKRGRLLKDVDPHVILIFAIDHFDDHATDEERQLDAARLGTHLSWASPQQNAVLYTRFGSPLPYARMLHAMRHLVSHPRKYVRRYYRRDVRCRPVHPSCSETT